MAKGNVIEISSAEAQLISAGLEERGKLFDKMVGMLLREGQKDAVKPIMAQVDMLMKLKERMDAIK